MVMAKHDGLVSTHKEAEILRDVVAWLNHDGHTYSLSHIYECGLLHQVPMHSTCCAVGLNYIPHISTVDKPLRPPCEQEFSVLLGAGAQGLDLSPLWGTGTSMQRVSVLATRLALIFRGLFIFL